MDISVFVGKWVLIGSVFIKSELEFIGNQPDPNGVNNWLNNSTPQVLKKIESTEDLILIINPDGTFEEEKTGNPKVEWFDCEGVLCSEVKPFSGYINVSKSKFYLMADECPLWAKDEKLRYNDGDTKISDTIQISNEQLIRTVSVVTDDMYFDKVVLVYAKTTTK
ncbi:hypothetical protein [Crocosphaera chwakensis]|uniref:Lipocalin-like domain-containing protein n=1 Tax=Crocosphaera chwakensis CCY0110 TaxID=391612 RepID=A3IUV0_9CHRO|nr:hypothetical protein [Crocosphaera chwakensis]EAZ89793.1 hypothetical protein CY0110_29279 [Crocosphaera chwakensis CCY0110]